MRRTNRIPLAQLLLLTPSLLLSTVPAKAQPVSGEAIAPSTVNPMTGTSLAVEALRRRLAEAQLQSRLEVELTNIERTRSERHRLAQTEVAPAPLAAIVANPAPEPASRPIRRPAQPARPARADLPHAAVLKTAVAAPRLVGVIQDGEVWTALIDTGGRTLALEAGQSEGAIRIGAIHAESAMINDHWQTVPAATHRLVLPVAPAATANNPTTASRAGAAFAVTTASNPFPGLTLGGVGAHTAAGPDATPAETTPDSSESRP
jgi:hypothetical protein